MMIAVAILAAILWGWKMRRLSLIYRGRADAFSADQRFWDRGVKMSESKIARAIAEVAETRAEARRARIEGFIESARRFEIIAEQEVFMLDIYRKDEKARRMHRDNSARIAQRYSHAARYPWLPVAPDPPEPE